MDHKVSKDMISSGMTPSGEKTQADLARTQYGSAPSPSRLMDAYKSMYEHHQKDKDGNTIPHENDINEGKIPAGLQAFLDKKKGKKKDDGDEKKSKKGKGKPDFLDLDKDGDKKEPMKKASKEMKEETDLFDTILNHFINEGYDEKDIISVMSNLSEEQLQSEDFGLTAMLAGLGLKVAGAGAAKGALAAGATKAAAAGATKAAAAGATKAAGSTIAKSGISRTIQRAGIKMGGKTGGRVAKGLTDYAKSDVGKMDLLNKTGNTISSVTQGSGEKVNKTGLVTAQPQKKAVAASADLFDIVKGQLLDEGLSEEEIRDIMLALTPEEIIAEMAQKNINIRGAAAGVGAAAGAGAGAAKAKPKGNYPAGKGANYQEKPQVPEKKKLGGRTDGTAGSYVEKPQIAQ